MTQRALVERHKGVLFERGEKWKARTERAESHVCVAEQHLSALSRLVSETASAYISALRAERAEADLADERRRHADEGVAVKVYAFGLDGAALNALFDRVAEAAHALDEEVTCSGALLSHTTTGENDE